MIVSIAILAAAGFTLSLYGYFTERRILLDRNYKPACDLSDKISCSKPILSEYGQLFFVSNALVGMAFYALLFLIAVLGFGKVAFVLSCGAIGASMVLAYLLYFKVGSFCLICNAIYAVNIALFILSLQYR